MSALNPTSGGVSRLEGSEEGKEDIPETGTNRRRDGRIYPRLPAHPPRTERGLFTTAPNKGVDELFCLDGWCDDCVTRA
eukprot:3617963-Pyramimonas_sp.AAC.1